MNSRIVLNSKKSVRRPSWLLKALSRKRYRWFILRNFSFRTTPISNPEKDNTWELYERANHRHIDFELHHNHPIWQQRQREQDATYSFLAKGLNDTTIFFNYKFRPKENDKLVIRLDDVINELVYEKGSWYMDNTNTYRNEEWDCWLINSGEVKMVDK